MLNFLLYNIILKDINPVLSGQFYKISRLLNIIQSQSRGSYTFSILRTHTAHAPAPFHSFHILSTDYLHSLTEIHQDLTDISN